MGLRGALDRITVASTERNDDWQACGTDGVEYKFVAMAKPLHGDLQPPQTIRVERIDSGLIKDDFGTEVEHARKSLLELGEIFGVGSTVGKFNIEFAALLAKWEVLAAVHGESEDIRIFFENLSSAITLVNIKVNNGETVKGRSRGIGHELPSMAEGLDGDGDIVEDAITGAFCAERVMRASGESSPESVLKGDAGCGESSTDTGESALDELFGPG